MSRHSFPILAVLFCGASLSAHGIIFDSTGDPSFNTAAPGGIYAGSGWQFEGTWGDFLGTAIAPNYFITAQHIGLGSTVPFQYGGHDYTVDQLTPISGSDLLVVRVTEAFATYASLYTGSNEAGKALVMIGRGTQRGSAISGKGWLWGTEDHVKRWGTNDVSSIADGGSAYGDLLEATFDHATGANEGVLSGGDSGGAVFIQDTDNLWKLAGINLGVSGPYHTDVFGNGTFDGALYDQTGYYVEDTPGVYVPAVGPGASYASRISSRAGVIEAIIPEPGAGALLALGAGLLIRRRR